MNIIVCCFDTLRHDAVFGSEVATPHLDRVAAESAVFQNAWGEAEPTIPYRRCVHTGRRSFPWLRHLGDRGSAPNLLGWHAIPEDQHTLAEILYSRGYVTGLVTDLWHMFKPTMNFNRGFVSWDFVRGQEADKSLYMSEQALEIARKRPVRSDIVNTDGPLQYQMSVHDRVDVGDFFASQVFERAARWVEWNRENAPFFLWIDSFSPHEYWDPPRSYADRYFQKEGVQDHIVPQRLNNRNPDRDTIARTQALYKGYVTFCDEQFGRFLDRLEAAGVLDDTILVVLSDHGTELWDKGRFGKSAVALHSYNTQLVYMIRHPELGGARQDVHAFVQNQDLVPTLLDLVGIPRQRLDGENVWPLVANSGAEIRDHAITGWDEFASVRTNEWNLIVNTVARNSEPRLYQLADDPNEERNVANEHPRVVADLLGKLEAHLGLPLPMTYVHRPAQGFAARPWEKASRPNPWDGSVAVE